MVVENARRAGESRSVDRGTDSVRIGLENLHRTEVMEGKASCWRVQRNVIAEPDGKERRSMVCEDTRGCHSSPQTLTQGASYMNRSGYALHSPGLHDEHTD